MKVVKVIYTVKSGYALQNQNNIKAVMEKLRSMDSGGINYCACLGADGKTFTHIAFFKSESDRQTLNDLPEFKHFQEQLKASGPETPPKAEMMDVIASSAELFPA